LVPKFTCRARQSRQFSVRFAASVRPERIKAVDKAGITTTIKLERSNKQDATCKLQQATCKESYYNYHKTCKLQEKGRGYVNAELSIATSHRAAS
jgi:hypothetical protein